jgi:hypothetical protein
MPLDPKQLLSLDKLSGATLVEVREQDPELYARLSETVTERRRETVATAFSGASAELRSRLSDVDLSPGERPEVPLRDRLLEQLSGRDGSTEILEEAVRRVVALDQVASLADPAAADMPLADHPLFQTELHRAKVLNLALTARLDLERASEVLSEVDTPSALDDNALRVLVDAKALEEGQARALGHTVTLFRLAGNDLGRAKALQRALPEPTDGAALAALGRDGWLTALRRGKVIPPAGVTVEEYADRLDRTVSALVPTDALMARVLSRPAPDGGDGEAARLVEHVYRRNPERELLTLDYAPGSADLRALDFGELSAEQRTTAIGELKAYQRMFALTDRVDHTDALRAAGYGDAISISRGTSAEFATRTGLAPDAVEKYYIAATKTTDTMTAYTLSVLDLIKGGFAELAVANLPPAIADFLRKLDGFTDLFGSQDSCSCSSCASILGPAAYFVDLMSFVEEHVGQYFKGAAAADPLNLKVRRPDLWKLPLTCENTNTLVPYLDIINEVCESYLAKRQGFAGDLGNRAAVEDFVYRQKLAVAVDSFRQPFTLPLVRLTGYLRHLDRTRAEVARTMARPVATVAAARLGLSAKEFQLITQPNVDPTFLSHVYGMAFAFAANGAAAEVNAQELARAIGLTRTELGELTAARFVTAGGAESISIVTAKSGPDAVQNDVELVRGLRQSSLDRLHRFARLTRVLPWTVAETDLVLGQLALAGLPAGLGEPVLAALADVLDVHERFDLPVAQNCALWSPVPRLGAGDVALFDRLFNLPTYVRIDGSLPKDTVSFVHPSLRTAGTPSPADTTLHRLMAALGATDDQLAALIVGLAPALNANIAAADESQRGFLLTAANLTLLYRHARLATLMDLNVADLLALLRLAGLASVSSPADLRALLDLRDWYATSGFTLDDLAVSVGGAPRDASRYRDPVAVAAGVVERVTADKALEFADTVFAFLPGVTESQSRAVIAANAGLFEATPAGDALRLVDGYDPAVALTVPTGVTAAEATLRGALLDHHASRVLPAQLAAQFETGTDRIAQLIAMTGIRLDSAPIVRAAKGGTATALENLARRLVPLTVLFAPRAFDAAGLSFARTHKDIFGIADFAAVSLFSVRQLGVYAGYAGRPDPGEAAATAPSTVDPADVRYVLATFDPATRFAPVDRSRLAAVLGTEPALVATLLPHITLPASAPPALAALGRAVDLAAALGLGGDALALVSSSDYAELNRASEAVLAAIRARYPDEKEFAGRLAPVEDGFRGQRRDALVDHLIRSLRLEFTTADDIYEYLLVDPQWEGCARTSRLVAAISSVQLYAHRILHDLEQDRRDPTDPARTAVPPTAIDADQWAWRRNYRVWEANRKVFLWPENYLEPELRDDKTPLFQDLESALTQQKVTPQNVLDAYGSYLDGFDEVSALRVAGSFHAKDPATGTDVLHLFGVTATDPPVYYYRSIENAHYSEAQPNPAQGIAYRPWRRIEVQIPVRQVSPVVHLGRLFLFWTEIVTTPKNEVKDGGSKFTGYKHRLTLRYTTLRLDGSWSAPQAIALVGGAFAKGDGIVDDPLATEEELEKFYEAIQNANASDAAAALAATMRPAYDTGGTDQINLLGKTFNVHLEPNDGYTLTGPGWDRVYPDVNSADQLTITGRNFLLRTDVDFREKKIIAPAQLMHGDSDEPMVSIRKDTAGWALYTGKPTFPLLDRYPVAVAGSDERYLKSLFAVPETKSLGANLGVGRYTTRVAYLLDPPQISVVNGSVADALLEVGRDLLYVQSAVRPGGPVVVKRLGTALTQPIARTLFTAGVSGLLATANQLALKEPAPRLTPEPNRITDKVQKGAIDFRGAYGNYFREVFFHVPFLLADHLNGQGEYESAQQWYRFIFDPTAAEVIPVPAGTPAAEAKRRQRDRVWRYAEFRNLTQPSLRQVLTDPAAIAAYHKDPFNPHAIARLRLSAYQKAVVMRYVDNLLDWGDSLFTEFTTESVNEATMLYVMASDILGRRPAELGSCGESGVTPRTYEAIAAAPHKGSEFLAELENVYYVGSGGSAIYGKTKRANKYTLGEAEVSFFAQRETAAVMPIAYGMSPARSRDGVPPAVRPAAVPREDAMVRVIGRARVAPVGEGPADLGPELDLGVQPEIGADPDFGVQPVFGGGVVDGPGTGPKGMPQFFDWNKTKFERWGATKVLQERVRDAVVAGVGSKFELSGGANVGWSVVRQISPAFCVPANPELRAYWDRVEDRLYKLRHCLDITGAAQQLALFAPEIDPRLLVRAKAAGVSLEDILAAISGDLPPYRFAYLIERAKQHASVVQAFGASLLGALERRDVEELTRLRSVHQQNLTTMTTRVREWELETAENAQAALATQITQATYRRDYYAGLLDNDLIPSETVEQTAKVVSAKSYIASSMLQSVSAVLNLIPQVGSPFAMKYGGIELGGAANAFALGLSDTAKYAELISTAAAIEAGFARRREGWEHQHILAQHELDLLMQQQRTAELRRLVAERSLALHNKQVEQQAEVFEFYRDRFTNLSLYKWLATTLQRLYRDAYASAYATARLAEQAYRFERNDQQTPLLRTDYFDATRGGLLAGEQLMIDLERLERRFIETNYRTPEIDQSFSLAQINPAGLVRLRETGACDFSLPEVFFDLFYPGQYRRRIRAVRLTIPAVTGPYTNVGASLALTGSQIRRDPDPNPTGWAGRLLDEPLRRSVSIATSTAQGDSGVFEFSFRDERYMPFEGAGAVSSWRLTLPNSFRAFDYHTITDVIVQISYTAEEDGVLRQQVEKMNDSIVGTIANYLKNHSLARVFSLRQDFSSALNRLVHSPADTPVKIELTDRHLPIFLRGRGPAVYAAKLVVRTPKTATGAHLAPGGLQVKVGTTIIDTFTTDSDFGDLYSADITAAFGGPVGERTLSIVNAGALVPTTAPVGDLSVADAEKLLDLMILLELRLA